MLSCRVARHREVWKLQRAFVSVKHVEQEAGAAGEHEHRFSAVPQALSPEQEVQLDLVQRKQSPEHRRDGVQYAPWQQHPGGEGHALSSHQNQNPQFTVKAEGDSILSVEQREKDLQINHQDQRKLRGPEDEVSSVDDKSKTRKFATESEVYQETPTGWHHRPTRVVPELSQRVKDALLEARNHLLPKDYANSVAPRYVEYVQWNMAASVVGTASSVISMQSLLMAVGLGQGAIPSAAALNWILKDGLGQLGGVLFASSVNQRFDAEPKRWRLKAAAILDASVLLEVMTPWFPNYFLPIASIANIGKNVGWLAISASRAGIHRSFMREENLGDITGKAGSQAIAASVVGTAFGIGLSSIVGTTTGSLLFTATVLSSIHMGFLYKSIQTVTINTLNLQRLWLAVRPALEYDDPSKRQDGIVTSDVDLPKVLSPEAVAPLETIVHFGKYSVTRRGFSILEQEPSAMAPFFSPSQMRGSAQLRIGSRLDEAFPSPVEFDVALDLALQHDDKHLINLLPSGTVHLVFLQGADPKDILRGALHAMHVYQAVVHEEKEHALRGPPASGAATSYSTHSGPTSSVSPSEDQRREAIIVRACRERMGESAAESLRESLMQAGWDVNHLFFEPFRARVAVVLHK